MRRERLTAAARYLTTVLLTVILIPLTGSVWVWSLLILLLLLPVVSSCCNLYVRRRLEGKFRLATTAAKATGCQGHLVLKNTSRLPAVKLLGAVGIINDLTREEETLEFSAAVGAGQETALEFTLESSHCGRLYVFVKSVKLTDWFGLFPLKVPMKAAARMTVLPELFACDVELGPVSAVAEDGSASSRGDDRTEVYQLREYQAGDDVRQIHWKLSSKLDSLILREAGMSISRSVLVFWDKRWSCAPEIMDSLAETTASVCQGLSDKGLSFDLGWTEGEELELRQVSSEEELLQTIPALVTQGGDPDCLLPDMAGYGRVIYLSSELPEGLPEESVFFLICAQEGKEEGRMVLFSPESYQERLERLEI